jgi:hypothetical protein
MNRILKACSKRGQQSMVRFRRLVLSTQQFQNHRFVLQKNHAIYWEEHAHELHAAACVLWHSDNEKRGMNAISEPGIPERESHYVHTERVIRMLFGMSLELLFKSVSCHLGKKIVKSHSLTSLAQSLNMCFTQDEKNALDLLSYSIKWEGRYPVPIDSGSFDRTTKLLTEIGTDRVPGSKINIRTPNQQLELPFLQKLWEKSIGEHARILNSGIKRVAG